MTVLELQSIQRAVEGYFAVVKKAGVQTWREDDEVHDGLLDIFNELMVASALPWPPTQKPPTHSK